MTKQIRFFGVTFSFNLLSSALYAIKNTLKISLKKWS